MSAVLEPGGNTTTRLVQTAASVPGTSVCVPRVTCCRLYGSAGKPSRPGLPLTTVMGQGREVGQGPGMVGEVELVLGGVKQGGEGPGTVVKGREVEQGGEVSGIVGGGGGGGAGRAGSWHRMVGGGGAWRARSLHSGG